MKLKVIIDNNKFKENYISEHGFSSLLETSKFFIIIEFKFTSGSLLFDTG